MCYHGITTYRDGDGVEPISISRCTHCSQFFNNHIYANEFLPCRRMPDVTAYGFMAAGSLCLILRPQNDLVLADYIFNFISSKNPIKPDANAFCSGIYRYFLVNINLVTV